jgi:urea transporter
MGQPLTIPEISVSLPNPQTKSTAAQFIQLVYQKILTPFLDGVSNTFFTESKIFAAVIGIALFIFAPKHAAASFACAILAVHYGRLLKTDRAGITSSSLAVNGVFLGLANAAFSANVTTLITVSIFGPALVAVLAPISKRLLLPWNLPILVLPYILAIWVLWFVSAGSIEPWFRLPAGSTIEVVDLYGLTTAYFRGFSEIFFIESETLGVVVFLVLMNRFRTFAHEIALAALYSIVVAWFLGFQNWIVLSGLTVFPAVFAVIACNAKFDKLDKSAKYLMVACAPFMEIVALRMGLFTGLPAISLAYLLLVWGGVLILSYRSQMEKTMWRASGIK